MNITVLDGFTLNPGDISWDALRALGNLTLHDHTPAAQVIERSKGAQALITNKTPLGKEQFAALPDLRYIGVTATGYNVVDTAAARERGIAVTNVPAYSTSSVAQHTIALLLELTNRVGHHSDTVRQGKWARSRDFCYTDFPLVELDGLTMGIVGFGKIGQAVARIAQSLGMHIITTSKHALPGMRQVSMDDLFRHADVITLHCPLTPDTKGLVNAARLKLMKPSAYLLNTGRGPLIVEADVAAALHAGQLAGAGLDVLSEEPPQSDNPLLTTPNCIITPHHAWASQAARKRCMHIVAANLAAFQAGKPTNVVNP